MSELKEQIEEARARVAQCRIRAERPGARLEDEYALEKARTRLLTLELKELKQTRGTRSPQQSGKRIERKETPRETARRTPAFSNEGVRTKRKQITLSPRQEAEVKFAALKKGLVQDMEGR